MARYLAVILFILTAIIMARGHSGQGSQQDVERYLTRDEAMKDMYNSLTDRLDQQEASIRRLQTSVAEKEERIKNLETELQEMKMDAGLQRRQIVISDETLPNQQLVESFLSHCQDGNSMEVKQKSTEDAKIKMDKRQSATTTNVAFSTSMLHDVSVHEQETLIFHHVLLDVGLGYNNGDGIYIVPQSGVYVFSWSVTSETNTAGENDIHTSLMVNGSPVGAIDSDADSKDWGSATGLVVVSVDYGDHVFVQVTTGSSGKIISRMETKSTFSGWLLF